MTRRSFFRVDDLKVKIEQLLKPSDDSLSSQCRDILTLVYKQLESFEEIAKITIFTDLDEEIVSEVGKLRGIVAQIASVQFFDDEDSDDEEEEEEKEDDDVEEEEEEKEDDDEEEEEEEEEDDDEEEEEEEEDDDEEEEEEEDDDVEEEEEEDGDGVELSIKGVENLKQKIHSSTPRLKMEVERCVDGLYNLFSDEEEEEEKEEGRDVNTSKMIGVYDVYEELKHKLSIFRLTSLVGMPGIGKTTLANKIFHDPEIVECFDCRVWIHVGKKCQVKDIPRRILLEIDPDSLQSLPDGDEEAVHEHLKASLMSKEYLIVLDDVWDRFITHLWHPFFRYEVNQLNHPFLHPGTGSRILLTSRLQQLNRDPTGLSNTYDCIVTMRLLNEKESWDLFCEKVFCKGSCPPQLVKAGKKISENCEGLPLTILTIARLLSKEDNTTPEYWNEVAAKKNHQIFMNAYDEISKVQLPSYTYLPRLLQMLFLYIGLFPRNYEIPRSKLINLWCADKFLELNINIYCECIANVFLEDLVSNSVVWVYKQSTYNVNHTVKTCGLHSSLRYLSNKKARETKFALVISSPNDCLGNGTKGHHRLSIHSNALFGMKDVHKSMEDNFASTARSLLCFGPYHQYQVPLCFRLKLLKELDALSIRFYEFPMEVLHLVRLSYLSLTQNGMIPPSISQLQSLEFLIVDRHQSIKAHADASYLPVEIWSLKKLKHLQVMGSDLPDPCGASMGSLLILSNVSARSCTTAILKGVPNLTELRIRIELAPDDNDKPLRCFDHISNLRNLEKLKCVIVNPEVVPPIVPFSSFPVTYLFNVSLSGLGYPWKELSKLASLPCLFTLKLKNYAFQGPEWEVEEAGFTRLFSLVIEDTDIVEWKLGCGAFNGLRSITIKHCYKLEKIHGEFGELLLKIELIDCNPSCIAEMKKAIPEEAKILVRSSWNDKS